jgi:hypothetical protein
MQQGGAKKMRLMVDSEYERFVNGNLPKPHPFVVSGGASDRSAAAIVRPESDILNDKKLGDDQKWKMISEQLHRMLQMTSEQRKRPLRVQIQADEDAGNSDKSGTSAAKTVAGDKSARLPNFVAKFPKHQWGKASNVIKYLKENSDIDWDIRGRVFFDGEEIEGSHIADLVKFALRTARGVGNPPTGWDEFCVILVDVELPPSLISNTQLKQILISHSPVKATVRTPEEQRTVAKRGKQGAATPSRQQVSSTVRTPQKKESGAQTRGKKILFEQQQQQNGEGGTIQHGQGRQRRRSRKAAKKGRTVKKRKTGSKGTRKRGTGSAKRIRWKAFG